jgi:sulfate adenylyltransferase
VVLTAEVAHRQRILEDQPEVFRRVFTLGQLARALDDAGVRADHATRGPDLLRTLGPVVRPPAPADDVVDPYRRGDEAAARAAEQLDGLVRRVVPLLG